MRNWRSAHGSTSLDTRAALVTSAVEALVEQKDAIAEELTRQMGRPISYTPGEVGGFEARARHMISIAEKALADVEPPAIEGFTRFIKRTPELQGTVPN